MGGFELLRTCVKKCPAAGLRMIIILLHRYGQKDVGQKDVGQENGRYFSAQHFSAPNVLASSTSH